MDSSSAMENTAKSEQKKPCANCGAELRFKPGSHQLKCEYCGYEEFIEQTKNSFEELELEHYLKVVGDNAYTDTIDILHCKNCGANQHVEENYKALHCVYCSEPLIKEDVEREGWIIPGALVPFQLNTTEARRIFKQWVSGIWFAPNKLKRAALNPESMHGLYVPFWTFDANLHASYQGQRGDYYYESQRYKTKNGMQTRQVRKTKWSSVSGAVSGFVDDILINASEKKRREIPKKIGRWNLKELVVFNSKYLAGFVTEKYTVSLKKPKVPLTCGYGEILGAIPSGSTIPILNFLMRPLSIFYCQFILVLMLTMEKSIIFILMDKPE